MSRPELFWEKVEKNGPDECWPWLASVSLSGHGKMRWGSQRRSAQRVSYELNVGPIPPGLLVRHACSNTRCVNPSHLVLGTIADNNADRMAHSGYQWFRVGQPRPRATRRWRIGPAPRPVKERLLEGIEKTEAGCWNWLRAKFHYGHGHIKVGGKARKAHRVSYETFVGPIPIGMMVLHKCDNPSCINPDHLHLGTHADNMAEMSDRGRAAKGCGNHFGRVKYQGQSNGFAKLTDDAVRQIRGGLSTKEAVRRFVVSRATVLRVRNGQSWSHVN